MSLTKCKECGHEVSRKASSCPSCGYNFKKEKEDQNNAIALLILIGLAVAGWFWVDSWESPERVPWYEDDNSIMAYVQIERHVRAQLISPSTADFPGVFEHSNHVERDGKLYTIESYVDSENRMGGTVRTYFVGEIEQVSENSWRLISLELK